MLKRSVLGWLVVSGVAASAQHYAEGEVLVRFRAGTEDYGSVQGGVIGARPIQRQAEVGATRLALAPGWSVSAALSFFRRMPNVEYAEPNLSFRLQQSTPNDPRFPDQTWLRRVQAPAGWAAERGSPDVIVAILDTGIDLDHPDLAGKIVAGYDFVNDDPVADDDHGHGTHCAGIAGAMTDNGVGVSGVGYRTSLMPVKVLDDSGSGLLSGVAAGIRWATDRGAKVISLSLGSADDSSTLRSAIDYAWSRGVLLVAAAGNNGVTSPVYPAAVEQVVAVGASTAADQRASFSNYGPWVDVAAPGTGLLSTWIDGYRSMSGTSMATPVVAGIAALVYSQLGLQATNVLVRNRIESSTDAVGDWVAHGRVNVARALEVGDRPELGRLELTPDYAPCGCVVTGTVSLTGPAGVGGAPVVLSTTNDAATAPPFVVVPEGESVATFPVQTAQVGSPRTVLVYAMYEGVQRDVQLRVVPAVTSLSEVRLDAASVSSRRRVRGLVRLAAPSAYSVRVSVELSSRLARAPRFVVVPRGRIEAAFALAVGRVPVAQNLTVTARLGTDVRTTTITLNP